MIISARAHTSSTGRSCAPTAAYCSSSKPLPRPPPCSTSTVWPACTSASAPAGTRAMRFSLVLISFGTPMIIVGSDRLLLSASARRAARKAHNMARHPAFGETGRESAAAAPPRGRLSRRFGPLLPCARGGGRDLEMPSLPRLPRPQPAHVRRSGHPPPGRDPRPAARAGRAPAADAGAPAAGGRQPARVGGEAEGGHRHLPPRPPTPGAAAVRRARPRLPPADRGDAAGDLSPDLEKAPS